MFLWRYYTGIWFDFKKCHVWMRLADRRRCASVTGVDAGWTADVVTLSRADTAHGYISRLSVGCFSLFKMDMSYHVQSEMLEYMHILIGCSLGHKDTKSPTRNDLLFHMTIYNVVARFKSLHLNSIVVLFRRTRINSIWIQVYLDW